MHEMKKADGDLDAQAKVLGVPSSFLPIDNPITGDWRSINTWEDYYKMRGIPFHSPMALVLDYPLTIFYMLKEHILPKYGDLPKKLVIHLVGTEREADIIPLFKVLLALLPGMELIIKMISPKIFEKIPADSRRFAFVNSALKSKLVVTLTTGMYEDEFLTGTGLGPVDDGKPDVSVWIC
jgi:hypothetical protein